MHAFLTVGPPALPLLWFRPGYTLWKKIIITVIVLILSYYLYRSFMGAMKTLKESYQMVF